MKPNNILNFIGFDASYEESKIVLFGAPYDGTTSFRPGTRFAPNVMRSDSYGLETYSPYMDLDLEDYKLSDMGDLEFPFGNTNRVMEAIEETTKEILDDKKIPLMIGGEHLVTYPVVKAVFESHPNLHIIHFDAHADLRTDYLGESLSHASVIRRCHDLVGDQKIFQFGIRSGTKEEFEFAKKHLYMEKFNVETVCQIVDSLKDVPVYITIDLDVLDPSIFSGTGTPEPGGITFKELQHAISLLRTLYIVGGDVVELAPQYDTTGVSTATACKVLRELALAIIS